MADAPVFLCHEDEIEERSSRGFDPWNDGRDTLLLVTPAREVFLCTDGRKGRA